jgi:uncharacterized membrane protein YhaH (DUF805 family)
MLMFRPLIRYADFKGRASRSEYWLFAVLQGLWYGLLVGLTFGAMGAGEPAQATPGVLIAFGIIMVSLAALVVPNYAVLVRRLHDSGRGAIWLCLLAPGLLSGVMMVGTIVTAVGAVGAGASREAFLGTVLTGLGAAGLLSRSMISSVSRTLWSVISTPMPRSVNCRTSAWMSPTAIGSMPAKGSSSRMKEGFPASARAISQAPALAARQRDRGRLAQAGDVELFEQVSSWRSRLLRLGSTTSSTARILSSTLRPRKIEASCGR